VSSRVKWVVRRKLAISPIPRSIRDIEHWKREGIKAVVILVEAHELLHLGGIKNYLKLLKEKGFEALHAPIKDFHVPSISQCIEIVKWISERMEEKKPVLIHCYGGLGRTGTIAACLLIYRYGLHPEDAIEKIRRIKPRSLESPLQVTFVYKFYDYIKDKRGI